MIIVCLVRIHIYAILAHLAIDLMFCFVFSRTAGHFNVMKLIS